MDLMFQDNIRVLTSFHLAVPRLQDQPSISGYWENRVWILWHLMLVKQRKYSCNGNAFNDLYYNLLVLGVRCAVRLGQNTFQSLLSHHFKYPLRRQWDWTTESPPILRVMLIKCTKYTFNSPLPWDSSMKLSPRLKVEYKCLVLST